ncbi:unnamed protein product [Clonostachys byssicola]|uniref:DUF3669 domain-containing protein n=1 Tax=Clonostachys byssicola TaxID=160290 RepID=A0A9N9V009_9HYPO|nr:unnamed protein product [Clonostachys byssicola]
MDRHRQAAARTDQKTLIEGLSRNRANERIVNFPYPNPTIDQVIIDAQREKVARSKDKALIKALAKASFGNTNYPRDVLKKALSVRAVPSTAAERKEALRDANLSTLKLVQIGRGSFGTVFGILGTEWCLKKTLTSPDRLWEEFIMGQRMRQRVNGTASDAIFKSEQFQKVIMPMVPRYTWSGGMDDAESAGRLFKNIGHIFPVENEGQKPGPVICLERIMPLPKLIRDNLIKLYFKPENRRKALADKANKHCLCRPYLGRRSSEIAPDKREKELQTLQNFPLYLDQLEDLRMEPLIIAQDMAMGLAAVHWSARANMLGVEYVIGSRPLTPPEVRFLVLDADEEAMRSGSYSHRVRDMAPRAPIRRNRPFQLWMVDFDKVSRFKLSLGNNYRGEIEQLVRDTRTSGPYYPRALPNSEGDWKLWLAFATTYISASKIILNSILRPVVDLGVSVPEKQLKLIFKRPSRIMNEWMRAESIEYNIDLDRFIDQAKSNGWEMP